MTGRDYGGFRALAQAAAAELADELNRPPVACPNDGELLEEGPGGILHCPWDGWTWP